MANTTNLGLGKLAGTEKLKTFPSMQADNMDTLDTAIGAGFGKNSKPSISQSMKNLGGGMAVLCDNNTHAAIPAGHYAYVMNHGTLTEGLYQNLSGSQIAANSTLSGSNLTAVSGGGLNSLYSNMGNMQLVRVEKTITIGDGRQTTQALEVDLSSYIPTSKSIVGNSIVRLGNYNLPYRSDDGVLNTWVEYVSAATKKIRIKSNASPWENYVLSFILFIQ